MDRAKVLSIVFDNFKEIVTSNKRNIFYLLYYSVLESVLLLVAPLTSAFIINSVLAHATVSIVVLSIIVIVIYFFVSILKVIKEYMIEKFEQKIFVENAIHVAKLATDLETADPLKVDKYMNYFFDVVSIQKVFPLIILNGSALAMKVFVSLLLLLIFDVTFFAIGLFFLLFFYFAIVWIGKRGVLRAIERSNAKHETIYFLQSIPFLKDMDVFKELDRLLVQFVKARDRMFRVVMQQRFLAYAMEGVIMATFFIVGGYLVFEGILPIGEFVAAEIVIITVLDALRDFMKQVDYMFEMIEGFYKIEKLEQILEQKSI